MAKGFTPTGSRSAQMGQLLGTTLGTGLNALIGHKVGQLQQRQGVKKYTDVGYTPQEAQLLATATPQERMKLIEHLGAGQPNMGQPDINSPTQPNPADNQQQAGLRQLMSLLGQSGFNSQQMNQANKGNFSFLPEQQQQLQQVHQLMQQLQQPQTQQPEQQMGQPGQLTQPTGQSVQQVPLTTRQRLATPQETPQMKQQKELARTKAAALEKHEARKLYQKQKDAIDQSADASKIDIRNLKVQQQLIKNGKLVGPLENTLINYIGDTFELGEDGKSALKNGDSQVFEKLSVPYFRNLKSNFGTRPTQWDAQQFQKSFPSLFQTDEGKQVIIEFMMQDANTNIEKQRIQDQILAKNNQVPPYEMNSLINKDLEKWQDKKYKELQEKTSNILAKQYAPTISAKEAGKNAMKKNTDNGMIFVSDGKKWKLAFSENLGE
jgi:hypothetical protein